MSGKASNFSSRDLIVIPSRYGSTRLPGKPLLKIAGRSLLERVVTNAKRAAELAGNCDLIVATDDARIADHAHALGMEVALTDAALDSGTTRAHAAAHARERLPERIINLQGDAPFVTPEVIASLITNLRTSSAEVATPVYQLDWDQLDHLRKHKRKAPFSGTTCVRGADGMALWFSKSIQPAIRNEETYRDQKMSPVWKHLGLYGYTIEALDFFTAQPPGTYEVLEGLEQLRFLENGKAILTVAVEPPRYAVSGVDTEHDLRLAEEQIALLGDPIVG